MAKKNPKCADCKKALGNEGHYICGAKACKKTICGECYPKHPCDKSM